MSTELVAVPPDIATAVKLERLAGKFSRPLALEFAPGGGLLAAGEQSSVDGAADDIIDALAQGNADYEQRFGFIFIVCATGKSAAEMLALLRARLPNSRDQEIANAAEEQRRIFHIRLDKLL